MRYWRATSFGVLFLAGAVFFFTRAEQIKKTIPEIPSPAIGSDEVADADEAEETEIVATAPTPTPSFFADHYPVAPRFRQELNRLRSQGRLSANNENLLEREIRNASLYLKIPPGVLWCLFFQESRLNHLEGIDRYAASHGLGQFTYFSFYEVNHHIDKYNKDNLLLMKSIFGEDIRPIGPDRKDIGATSSYYSIPTAVMASSIFLNNRYHQLRRILERKKIKYDPDILWLSAVYAYNKGTRSVISFWNETRRRRGNSGVAELMQDPNVFLQASLDYPFLRTVLKRIWNPKTAARYAKELQIHVKNVSSCSMPPESLKRSVASLVFSEGATK